MTFSITGQYLQHAVAYSVSTEDFTTFHLTRENPGHPADFIPENVTLVKSEPTSSNLDKYLLELIEEWRNDLPE
ncbi:hypothetical protein V9K67_18770 [Paraflavisolibacter sp. H34]|uniref:hypothetical protein n=1 Tax=Huijunlia imazamoxiresistens TaxID=3127457 RepID=UPI0030163FD5